MNDIENATKARQCAALLCADIQELMKSENTFLYDLALALLVEARAMENALDRAADNLKLMQQRGAA